MSQTEDARRRDATAVVADALAPLPASRAGARGDTAPSASRIVELDALRGLAALAVVLFHFTTRYGELFGHASPLGLSFPWGEYGVQFFFILSGLMILRSLDRSPGSMHFAASRFARLYPAYWAAAATTFAAITLFGLPGEELSVREALLNATMLQQLFGARHIDGAYWSLQFELAFYAGAWACHRAGVFRTENRLYLAVACWLAASAAFQLAPIAAPTDHALLARAIRKAANLASLRYAQLFGLGIVLYQAARSGRAAWPCWALAAGCCILQGLVDCWPAAAFVAAAGLTVFAASQSRLRWLRTPGLALLGVVSYSLYLIHQRIGYILIHHMEARGAAPLLAVLVAIAMALLLAAGLTFAIERPGQRWLKARLRSDAHAE